MSNILLQKKPSSIEELRQLENNKKLEGKLIVTYYITKDDISLVPYLINGSNFHKAISKFINLDDLDKLPYVDDYYPNKTDKYAFYISNMPLADVYLLNTNNINYLFSSRETAEEKYKTTSDSSAVAYIVHYKFISNYLMDSIAIWYL